MGCGLELGALILPSGTEGRGVNVYTHSEMLPAHGYPELKKYPHLKGNFGTAWQNQRTEFANIPAPILFTTNCLMPPAKSYADRVFTTGEVSFPGTPHIGADKDFTPVIERALELGGYSETQRFTGINGGSKVTTGFGQGTVLSIAGDVVEAVKAGKIRHFFLVGGCDGARNGRNYYTDFVKQTPSDTVILTLACGKYRFNDLDLGCVPGTSKDKPWYKQKEITKEEYDAFIATEAILNISQDVEALKNTHASETDLQLVRTTLSQVESLMPK